ncbi:MAG: hypothetical protein NT116_02975, partial [Candidatus Parcubacteria bacterium]|nr:hypothetical protein [Candidatus Parcubacteria bacterium]
ASFILSMLIENGGAQQPVGNGNVNGGGLVNGNFNGNGNQIPNTNGEFPTTYLCKGAIPDNANVCPTPNATGLLADNTQNELVPSCSNDPTKCEYICQLDFNIVNGSCVNGDPSLPSDYQAYYSFTTDANDSSSNNFNGTVYRYSGGTSSPDPPAISNGVLNLDGSHYVRVNNFTIGPSFTVLARVKSDSAVWNDYGWIVSSEFSDIKPNSFIIHPNSNSKSWSGYIYDNTGGTAYSLPFAIYSPPASVNITDWHIYGIEYDNDNHLAKMIFDHEVVISKQTNLERSTSNLSIDIGHDSWAANSRFGIGQIDWVYIYNRALY